MSALLLGAIADDYTGAADLASMLREQGLRTGLLFGVPSAAVLNGIGGNFEAVVIALKSRSTLVAEARDESLRALERLRQLQARQLYFKYCSTFDSTARGNIGPVSDALMDALETDFTVAVPALPVNGRTLYEGHLFVDGVLLSESHMKHHPINPMTDANLVRHLQNQTRSRVGLINHRDVRAGARAIGDAIRRCHEEQVRIALVDATSDLDLQNIAAAVADLPLLTGSSGLGMAMASEWARQGLSGLSGSMSLGRELGSGGTLILSGSCSVATLKQLAILEAAAGPGLRIDVSQLITSEPITFADRLFGEIRSRLRTSSWALVYSSATHEERGQTLSVAAQNGINAREMSLRIEKVMAELARQTVEAGIVDSLVVAGGETTGAVTQALNVEGVEVGPALDPGVPITRSIGQHPIILVLKSGNFGSPDFFLKALERLNDHQLSSAGTARKPVRAGPS